MDCVRQRRSRRVLTAAAVSAVALAAITLAPTAPVAAAPARARSAFFVARGRPTKTLSFRTHARGEVLVDVTAAAPGVSWATAGAESAVIRIAVDGRFATDDVVMEPSPVTRSFDLGTLDAGRHALQFTFDTNASAAGANVVRVLGVHTRNVASTSPAYVVLSHAPVLYGRNGVGVNPAESGPYQNAVTDTPLVAWHEDTPTATAGRRHLEYSIIWSNEDGGTSTPALMARWGRTTDIEWIYQVDVDATGHTVPGTAVFQSPNHGRTLFTGTYEGDRPLLQTCTLNNNVCDRVDDPMRFSLSTLEALDPSTHAREQVMDANPWTYRVMADEVRREGKVDPKADPAQTTFIADPSDYLYLVVRKHTVGVPNNGIFWVGLAIGVRLHRDPTLYRSDGGVHPDWSLQRDDPAATTVRLPPGTRPRDIAEIDAIRVAFGPDTGATINVGAINRAFFLGRRDEPRRSFLSGPTPATLTVASPTAVLYASR